VKEVAESNTSSQMHSSHHCICSSKTEVNERRKRRRAYHVNRKGASQVVDTKEWEAKFMLAAVVIPPASIAQSPGIHLAHITQTNDAYYKALHDQWSVSLLRKTVCQRI